LILNKGEVAATFASGESTEFSGKCVAHLAADRKILSKSGKILMTGDLSVEYNFVDDETGSNHDLRSVSNLLKMSGHTWMAALVPGFVRIPLFVMKLLFAIVN
jgi:hypothetical protein